MEINGNIAIPNLQRFGFAYINAIEKNAALIKSPQQTASPERTEQSFHLMYHAMRIRRAIEAIKPFMDEARSAAIVSAARAESVSDLELEATATPTTLTSTEEVNSTPTSISTFGPEATGSTAQVTVGGAYNGANGTQTLTFEVVAGGTHGQDNVDIRVYNSSHTQIGRILIRKTHAMNQAYNLSNGLSLTFGAGEMLTGDSFTVNVATNPNSYSPTQPEWEGSTPGLITLGGVYDGSNGTGALNFQVNNGGTHGVDDLRITVYSGSTQIGQLDIRATDPLDQVYTLSNGITLQMGEGSLLAGSDFSVNVFDSIGSAVDPDKAFNAVRTNDPNLQQGYDVVAGSFSINGVEIAVQADDTINTVLDRITQSDAGVTATFDAAAEKVLLTQKTNGSSQGIVLGSDTSGFLAAVKLADAVATPGQDSEATSPLAEVARFASVQSGTISVNGINVAIDVDTDSLNDVLDRISNSGADVVAAFDSNSGRVSVLSENQGEQLILDSGATNFFPAVEISDGTYNSEEALVQADTVAVDVVSTPNFMVEYARTFSTDESSAETAESTADAPDAKILGTLVKVVAGSLNAMFDDSAFASSPSALTTAVRQDIRDAVATWRDSEGPDFKTDFGIRVDPGDPGKRIFNFSADDQRLFESAISNPEGRSSVQQGLFGTDSSGLFSRLHAAMTRAASRLEIDVGTTGVFLDAFA